MSRIGADWAIRSVIIRITDYISIRTLEVAAEERSISKIKEGVSLNFEEKCSKRVGNTKFEGNS